jgi:hypothetical protein
VWGRLKKRKTFREEKENYFPGILATTFMVEEMTNCLSFTKIIISTQK